MIDADRRSSDRAPPQFLRDALGWTSDQTWLPLDGGRSNRIWKVSATEKSPIVAKLFSQARGNAMFPNEPESEALALKSLKGQEFAPDLVGTASAGSERAIFYTYVDGPVGPANPKDAANTLARLHATPPLDGLRQISSAPAAIAAQAQTFAKQLSRNVLPPMPETQALDQHQTVFLHGDPVPANMIQTDAVMVLIDWQCPASGDPCEDIAIFLSPAMQALYGGSITTAKQTNEFFGSYGAPSVARRYLQLAPIFHWRMAAYCLWMADNGSPDYGPAGALEISALEKAKAEASANC